MFEFTSAKIDIIADALHENVSPAKWKTENRGVFMVQLSMCPRRLIVCTMLPHLPS